jgi:hypothetical protein
MATPLTTVVFGVSVVAIVAGSFWERIDGLAGRFRSVVALSVVGGALALAATLAGSVLFSGRLFQYGLVLRLPALVALFSFVPAGYAVRRGNDRLGVLVAALGVGAALALAAPLTDPYSPFRLGTRLLFATVSALASVAVGLPFFVVGRSLAGE